MKAELCLFRRNAVWRSLIIGLALFVSTQSVRAEFLVDIASTVQQDSPDSWKYNYVVTNHSTMGERVYVLDVNFGIDVSISGITAPTDWTIFFNPGDSGVSWLSDDPARDILPGMSASFSMLGNAGPDNHVAVASGEDDQGGGVTFTAFVKGPGPGVEVPEPSSFASLVVGALLSACLYLRRWLSLS